MHDPLKDSLSKDLKSLLGSFGPSSDGLATFGEFQRHWMKLDFSLVHYCSVDRDNRSYLYNAIFDILTAMLHSTDTARAIPVVYCIYLVYFTMPFKRSPIPLPVQVGARLLEVIEECRLKGCCDPMACIIRLVREDAFVIVSGESVSFGGMENAEGIPLDPHSLQALNDIQKYLQVPMETLMSGAGNFAESLLDEFNSVGNNLPDNKEFVDKINRLVRE